MKYSASEESTPEQDTLPTGITIEDLIESLNLGPSTGNNLQGNNPLSQAENWDYTLALSEKSEEEDPPLQDKLKRAQLDINALFEAVKSYQHPNSELTAVDDNQPIRAERICSEKPWHEILNFLEDLGPNELNSLGWTIQDSIRIGIIIDAVSASFIFSPKVGTSIKVSAYFEPISRKLIGIISDTNEHKPNKRETNGNNLIEKSLTIVYPFRNRVTGFVEAFYSQTYNNNPFDTHPAENVSKMIIFMKLMERMLKGLNQQTTLDDKNPTPERHPGNSSLMDMTTYYIDIEKSSEGTKELTERVKTSVIELIQAIIVNGIKGTIDNTLIPNNIDNLFAQMPIGDSDIIPQEILNLQNAIKIISKVDNNGSCIVKISCGPDYPTIIAGFSQNDDRNPTWMKAEWIDTDLRNAPETRRKREIFGMLGIPDVNNPQTIEMSFDRGKTNVINDVYVAQITEKVLQDIIKILLAAKNICFQNSKN